MSANPTKKQVILIEFIEEFSKKHGYSPSYREIMHAMGLRSVSAVAEHVENCVANGFLKRTPKSARSLEVIKPDKNAGTVDLFKEKIGELKEKGKDSKIEVLEDAAEILGLKLD